MNQKSCPEPVTALISNSRQSREKKKIRDKCSQKQVFTVSKKKAFRYSSLAKSCQMNLIKRRKQLYCNVRQKLAKLKLALKSPY